MSGHLHELLRASVGGGAGHAQQQQQAQRALLEMEGSPGFVSALIEALASPQLLDDARLMAVMCLKAVVSRCWKPRGSNMVVPNEEKQQLRAFLSSYFAEQNRLVATHVAILASKVARVDWPREWPEAFEVLYSPLTSPDHTLHVNALYRLHRTLKELSIRSNVMGKQEFVATCAAIFPQFRGLFVDGMEQLQEALRAGDFSRLGGGDPAEFIDRFMTMVKIVNRLLVHGLVEIRAPDEISQFLWAFVSCLQHLLQYLRANLPAEASEDENGDDSNSRTTDFPTLLQRLLSRMSQVLVQLQGAQPLACRQWLPSLLGFFFTELLAECQKTTPPLKGLSINALLFLSKTISCNVYNPESSEARGGRAKTLVGDIKVDMQEVREARSLVEQFVTDQVVEQLLDVLLHTYLHLTAGDLKLWVEQPEDFATGEESSSEQDSMRTSAESLFLALVDVAPEHVLQRLVGLLSMVDAQLAVCQSRIITSELLTLDATYLCAGLANYALSANITGDQLISVSVGPVLEQVLQIEDTQPPPILRRRLLWLMRCWAHFFEQSLPTIVAMAVQLLQGSGPLCDPVVKLGCVQLLVTIFQREDVPNVRAAVTPHLLQLLQAIYTVIGELEELESKSQAVSLLTETVNIAGKDIGPYLQALVEPLPSLWVASNSENPLHPALIAAVTAMVKTCGKQSNQLYPVALQMIDFACGGDEDTLYLVHEGLQLWLAVVRNAPSYTEDLHALFPRITALGAEALAGDEVQSLPTALLVIEAYAYLGAQHVLESYAVEIARYMELQLNGVTLNGAQYLIRILEAFLLSCPEAATGFLVQSGVLNTLVSICVASALGHTDEPPVQIAMYMSVLAKVLLVDPSQLNHICEAMVASGQASSMDHALGVLFDIFLDKFDSLGYAASGPYRRRLWVVSWLSLYPTDNRALLERFPAVLIAVDSVYAEQVSEGGQERLQSLNRLLVAESDEMMYFEDPHQLEPELDGKQESLTELVSALLESDPIMRADLVQEVHSKIMQYQQMLPQSEFQALLAEIPTHVQSTLLASVPGWTS